MRAGRSIRLAVLCLIALPVFLLPGCGQRQESEGKVAVAASFYPLAEFSRQVGGDRVAVVTLTPSGAEPHGFDPSPQDVVTLRQAEVFIYAGAGFEPWAERLLPDLGDVTVINASEGIALLPAIPDEEEGGAGGGADPHYYLDPVLAQQIVQTIADRFTEIDPEGAGIYQANADAYKERLAELDREFLSGLRECRRQDVVTSHAAFAYPAGRYGFRQVPIAGLSEEEPSPARLAEIAEFARQNQIEYIFFESLVSPRLSETIAAEVGAGTMVLNPIEGLTPDEEREGKEYLALMRENLANLRLALGCE